MAKRKYTKRKKALKDKEWQQAKLEYWEERNAESDAFWNTIVQIFLFIVVIVIFYHLVLK